MEHLETERERMEALCCLSVIGELSPEESVEFTAHLPGCKVCRDLLKDYEQITFFDLANLDAAKDQTPAVGLIEASTVERIFDRVRERAQIVGETAHFTFPAKCEPSEACPQLMVSRFKRLGPKALAFPGWAIAAGLFVALLTKDNIHHHENNQATFVAPTRDYHSSATSETVSGSGPSTPHADETSSAQVEALQAQLANERDQAHIAEMALANSQAKYVQLERDKVVLEAGLEEQKQQSAARLADYAAVAASLNQQIGKSSSLEAELREVSDKLLTQKAEVAKLERVASQVPVRMPITDSQALDDDARELFGARDLHIVDVYDVDHSGKSTRTFGRVYFVNHRLLVFYAFDLKNREKDHKPVAFQAWGYKQPNSLAPESLGLFVMDDAQLDRWVLRISDPKLLSSIDTMFVTIEPPGGSPVPKGHPLLLASLGGPANHP